MTVFVFTIQGFVVRGSTLTVRTLLGTPSPVVDRLNGVYTFTYTAPTVTGPTSVSIRVDAAKATYFAGTARITVQVLPP